MSISDLFNDYDAHFNAIKYNLVHIVLENSKKNSK